MSSGLTRLHQTSKRSATVATPVDGKQSDTAQLLAPHKKKSANDDSLDINLTTIMPTTSTVSDQKQAPGSPAPAENTKEIALNIVLKGYGGGQKTPSPVPSKEPTKEPKIEVNRTCKAWSRRSKRRKIHRRYVLDYNTAFDLSKMNRKYFKYYNNLIK